MVYKYDGYNWIVRLDKGELLIENLISLIKDQDIKGAWVSGIGGAAWAEIGFYDLPNKKYKWQKINEPLEIISLQGNIARDGNEPVLHVHGNFSDSNMKALGGHVKELEVAGTCEVLLHRWYLKSLDRRQNNDVGLKLLDL